MSCSNLNIIAYIMQHNAAENDIFFVTFQFYAIIQDTFKLESV